MHLSKIYYSAGVENAYVTPARGKMKFEEYLETNSRKNT
jgi:hypothetical protein